MTCIMKCGHVEVWYLHWRWIPGRLTLHYNGVNWIYYVVLNTLFNDHWRLSDCGDIHIQNIMF